VVEFKVFGGHGGGVPGRQQALHGPALPRVRPSVLLAGGPQLPPGIAVVTALLVHAAAALGRFVQLDHPEKVFERPGRPGPDVSAPPLLLPVLLPVLLLLVRLLVRL